MTDNAANLKSRARTRFNAVAADYDSGPGCFAHFGIRLAVAAQVQPGHRVLDIATGRGAALFPCAERVGPSGEAIGVDLAEDMVRVTNDEAVRRGIPVSVRVMDGEHLLFADATFDRVLCAFGIMFFPDQVRALREFRRVMKPGGRIAVSTWRVAQNSEITAAMTELGMREPRPPGWITEPKALSKLLAAAGFSGISVDAESSTFRYAGIDEYWQQARGTGMREALDVLSASDAARLRDALTRRVNLDGSGQFCASPTALIATASHQG